MNTRHSEKISRNAAERLLDGHAGAASDPLARVLAAAAAPARESELAGEQMAVAAFEAHHLVPVTAPQKRHKSMLAKLLTLKVLVSSFAVCATGGVAVAASTGALPGSGSPKAAPSASQPATSWPQPGTSVADTPSATASAQPTAPATNPMGGGPEGTPSAAAQPTTSASASPSATPSSLPQTATALCRALIGDVASLTGGSSANSSQSGQEQALSSPKVSQPLKKKEFSPLVSTAQSPAAVPDYCALLLALPQLPQPSELAALPGTLLAQLLTALPTSTLTQVLTSLPSSTLSQVLTALPTSALSQILTSLPSSIVSQLLNELPTSALAQLPSSVLSQLPTSVLNTLPTSVLGSLGL
jgi:MgtE intracellular N domain